ncbi:MAG: peptide chain release factor N(5)-glutamine methyltransferase [Candidatus Omnitrophica bacterium]|nr:peptide chain release factor N(5)-glutamine methyltransferase [Candidatus Omnitrophota bacterium]MBU1932804.1 peptide chain release factor N(5)-glutamine methyltransferase [Candidatus Omnitrophota bacterium]
MIKTINKFSKILPRYETEVMLTHLFGCARSDLYMKDMALSEDVEELLVSMARRRLAGEPLQYIIGRADFMGMELIVRKGVFIPRQETELLIEGVLSAIRYTLYANRSLKILDLCTGSGCIAVSLAKNIPAADITATDISGEALETAKENVVRHGVSGRVRFYKGDLFEPLVFDKSCKFDIIVCNPPYIRAGELESLQQEVRQEPGLALDGGPDGLDFYRRIALDAHENLKTGGSLFLEIGVAQSKDVQDIFSREKLYMVKDVIKDFAGIDRVLWIGLS